MGKKSRRGGRKQKESVVPEACDASSEKAARKLRYEHCEAGDGGAGRIGNSFEVNVYEAENEDSELPLYRVIVLDTAEERAHEAACFIVPRGKESTYLYASLDGLKMIAERAESKRLIVVRLDGRGRSRPAFDTNIDIKLLQKELEPVVIGLAPDGYTGTITFFTTESGTAPKVLASGKTLSGDTYFVEEYVSEEMRTRCLVFGSNTNVLQTEVTVSKRGIVKNRLVSRYHAAITAGLAAFSKLDRVCLIGLGGGALATTLLEMNPNIQLTIVELDQAIVSVAQEWFAFPGSKAKICVADGLTFFQQDSEGDKSYDAIVVDVDAKNSAIGISCPPLSFLEPAYLRELARSLRHGGFLLYNLVARDPMALDLALGPKGSFRNVFTDIAILQPDKNDLNITLFATHPRSDLHSSSGLVLQPAFSDSALTKARAQLASWLADTPKMATDPYDFIDLFSALRDLRSR